MEMTKSDLIDEVRKMIKSPSCYEGLRDLGKKWLAALDTDKEKETAKKLIEALKEDVRPLDATIGFLRTEEAIAVFGKEMAQTLLKKGEEAKAKGEKICFCDACQAGHKVLEHKDLML